MTAIRQGFAWSIFALHACRDYPAIAIRHLILIATLFLVTLVTPRQAAAVDFAHNYATASTISFVNGTAVDGAGNVYIGGYFFGATMAVGGTTLTKIGSTDLFVAKLDAGGNVLWAKNFGGAGANSQVNGLAIDGSGNIYLTGFFNGANFTSPAMTKIGTQDVFAIKLDSTGIVVWAKNFGGAGATSQGLGIAADGSGNIYLTGFLQTANLTTPALTKIGTKDVFAIKLDSTGAVTWAQNYGGAGASAQGNGIAVDGSGNVYLTGFFQSANLTTPALTKIGNQDFFATKLDSTGATSWSRNYGGAGANAQGAGVTVDGSGNVYLAGTLNTASLTTPALARIGSRDALAVKLDSTGSMTWIKNFGGAGANVNGIAIAIDSTLTAYLYGHFFGADLTTPALTKIGSTDTFAVKLDTTGATIWAKNFGGASVNMSAGALTVDNAANLYMGGFFQSGNLTTPALTEIGADDAYIIKQSTVLGAPVIGVASGAFGGTQATVTFTAPVVDGGFAVSGYTVTSIPAGGVDTNAGGAGLSHLVTGLFGTNYTFTVTATNVYGPGMASAASNSVVLRNNTPPPAAPPKIGYSAPQAVSENGTTSSVTFALNGGTPSAGVTLPIVSTNTNEVTVSPASITFVPGGPSVQSVTFTGVDDQVVDGDQAVLIQVGPAVSTDSNYNGYSPGNFVIVNRDNDMALPALPFAGGSLSGFVDITNPGSSAIASIAARAYDKTGALKGTGTITQNLPAKGTVSIDMATLQAALGVTGVSANDDARIELLPVGGDISAQARIKFSGDTINASAANRVGAANLPSSTNADQFTLRITNLSASPQDARATLYSDSGSLLSAPSVLLASQLAPRASLDLSASSLQSILGIAPWAGRAQLTMDKGGNFAVQMMNVATGMRTMNPMLGIGNGGGTAINYILPPGDVTGDSFVRVYNQENFAVPYVGSLYNSSGTLLGSAAMGNATANGELILTSSQLKSLFGNATWTGPARLVIASDMSSFGAQSTVRHANVLTDVSTVITDNVINHLPDATEGVDIELRIVNPSALTTIATGTLTNSAGQTVGSANFAIGTLAPNASLMLSRANLQTLAGTWSGRATLTLSTNNAVEVLALLRNTTTGAFTNLSERPLR